MSQIGEFSFIVGQAGVALGVLSQEQYGLILASALLAIVANPLLFRAIPWAERLLQRAPGLWRRLDRSVPTPAPGAHSLADHVVVVGFGRVGEHIVQILHELKVPHLVVERDAARAADFQRAGTPTLFGDAANSELLTHAGLEHARALVVTIPDEAAAELVVAAARDLAPQLPIVARAATREGVRRLAGHGAQHVIQPELEGGLEVLRHTLLTLGYPQLHVQRYADAVRGDAYDITVTTPAERQTLDDLIAAVRGMEIVWHALPATSPLVGRTLAETNLRARTGASVVGLAREGRVLANPKSSTVFVAGDVLGLLGDAAQVAAATQTLLHAPPSPSRQPAESAPLAAPA